MTEPLDLTKPIGTMMFYESPEPDPRREPRTYDAELIYDGVAYPVTVTERSDGSMHIRSHRMVPHPDSR